MGVKGQALTEGRRRHTKATQVCLSTAWAGHGTVDLGVLQVGVLVRDGGGDSQESEEGTRQKC